MSHGESAHLNIGYIANIHYNLLPTTLGAFRKLYPLVALNLFDMTSAEQFVALENHKIDLGFIDLRPELSGSDLLSQCFAHTTMLAALPVSHPLAKKAKIKLTDLTSEFFITKSPKTHPSTRAWLMKTYHSAGFSAKILQEAEPLALRFIADGLGVALLPEQITRLKHDGVVLRPLTPPLHREATIAWRADNPSKPLKEYIQIVKDISPC